MLHSLHKPELIDQPGMVYEIWEDGEITLTKSGDLYGQRNLHCIVPGMAGVSVPLPNKRHAGHSSMAVAEEDIVVARKLILGDRQDPYASCLPGKKLTPQELFDEINRRYQIHDREINQNRDAAQDERGVLIGDGLCNQ
jgi:hypothetical protein